MFTAFKETWGLFARSPLTLEGILSGFNRTSRDLAEFIGECEDEAEEYKEQIDSLTVLRDEKVSESKKAVSIKTKLDALISG